ncbi:sensor histidine kinase [Rhodobacteraceae bacterium CCMM004]|nr:sensor histidine kinase [Rhodobacteraceae bacterium CCMM004]
MLVPGRGFGGLNRLDVRLVVLLGIALLPIGLIAMVQTYRVIDDSEARLETALLGVTHEATLQERMLLMRARGKAEALADLVPLIVADPANCTAQFEALARDGAGIGFAGWIDEEGIVGCGSSDVGASVAASPVYQRYKELGTAFFSATRRGVLTGQSVAMFVQPVAIDDAPAGYVAVSVPQQALSVPETTRFAVKPVDIVAINRDGVVLTSQLDLDTVDERLPLNLELSLLAVDKPQHLLDTDRAGEEHLYTVAPILPGTMWAVSIWPPDALAPGGLTAMSAVVFPFLMWLASLAVAFFAVHRLVTRHIRTLRQRIRAFTMSRTTLPLRDSESEAPQELREVFSAFADMTERIARDEADLEDSLHEKTVLLKEVHHRVKNNLQLIASITNMQIRKARSAETRHVLRRLQDRVLGLATIHRSLYQSSVLSNVRADELVGELARQIVEAHTPDTEAFDVRIELEPVSLYPDQAVPLSLLATEALNNALKHLGHPPEGRPYIYLAMSQEADTGRIRLVVENSRGAPVIDEGPDPGGGLGNQLIAAFVLQLGALSKTVDEADRFALDIRFTATNFESTEEAA